MPGVEPVRQAHGQGLHTDRLCSHGIPIGSPFLHAHACPWLTLRHSIPVHNRLCHPLGSPCRAPSSSLHRMRRIAHCRPDLARLHMLQLHGWAQPSGMLSITRQAALASTSGRCRPSSPMHPPTPPRWPPDDMAAAVTLTHCCAACFASCTAASRAPLPGCLEALAARARQTLPAGGGVAPHRDLLQRRSMMEGINK